MCSGAVSSFASQGQSSKKPKRKSSVTKTVHFEVNLDESDEGEPGHGPGNSGGSDSEMEEEGEPNEFFDILDVLDGRADPLSDGEPSIAPSHKNETSQIFSAEEDGEEEANDDDEYHQDMDTGEADQFAPSDDEVDMNALHSLGRFVSDLDSSTKRKTSEGEGAVVTEDNAPRKKRKLLKERNEARAENEFSASGEP